MALSLAESLPKPAMPDAGALAIHGGEKVRTAPMPPRVALGPAELGMIEQCLAHYRERQVDPGYQGPFEKLYTDAFEAFMGGGYADAVATGTSALFVAIAALELPKGSEVIVSPITDPGTLAAIILNGLKPRLADARPDNYNMGAPEFRARITKDVTGLVLVHSIGQAAEDVEEIVADARRAGIKVLEDCSQSHGARVGGRPVGAFGDIAAFSTMYRKGHMTGPSGGVVYARDLDLFRRALAHADRGKPRWRDDFDDRDPTNYLFPALNHNTDEISCAVGVASLGRLQDTIVRRLSFVTDFVEMLLDSSEVCRPYAYSPGDSPFVFPVIVDTDRIACSKREFAEAVRAEGIDLSPHYNYLVAQWHWVKPHLADGFVPTTAQDFLGRSFNLYLNEKYGRTEAEDAVAAIVKVERHFRK
jgi:dTDP-4-amino-4,6-dideoxygalactose transaminase